VRFFPATCLLAAVSCLALTIAAAREGNLVQQAPSKASASINPYQGDPKARMAGAKLYMRECAACHGADAGGSGKAPPLALPRVSQAPPGALYWVLRNGSLRHGMPSFAHLPEPQRWQIITYIGSLH
jgi:mono/diheme cytochrome c family protein